MIRRLRWVLLAALPLLCGACSLVEIALDVTPAAADRTATPLINIASLPTLPRLAAEATATPEVSEAPANGEGSIAYDNEPDIFRNYAGDDYAAEKGAAVRLRGRVGTILTDSFELSETWAGVTVKCDDGCFLTDGAKRQLGFSSLQQGDETIVFGATDGDDAAIIIADLIVVRDPKRTAAAQFDPEALALPYGFHYAEYALAGAPELSPLSFETKTGELDVPETLAGRLKLSLSERSRFAYGAYGEVYSTGTEYTNPMNRAAGYPTRAQLSVYSNAYEFFTMWFPYAAAPFPQVLGILNYGGDWFLPLRLTVDIDPDPAVSEIVSGDRTIMSQLNFDRAYGYVRTFGLSILNSTLFYFYERENGLGFSLNRTDYALGFDEILFGQIRPYAELNPFYSDYLIAFFGKRGESWYYAEVTADPPAY